MEIIILLVFFTALCFSVCYFIVIKGERQNLIVSIVALIITVFLIGALCGIKKGESNVLKGKPTYRMVINYQETDSIASKKDTAYVLK